MIRRAAFVVATALAFVGVAAGATPKPSLTVAITGNGTVSSQPAGIDCRPACTLHGRKGEKVTLTATPESGAEFSHWSAPCGESYVCTVKLTTSRVVHAFFTTPPPAAPLPTPPTPTLPRSGHYVGKYTDGTFFNLDVQGTLAYNLYFDFNGSCSNGGNSWDTGFVAFGPYAVAADGSFSGTAHKVFSNATVDATLSGTISSVGLASGNLSVTIAFNTGVTCTSKGTWTAQDQS